MTDRQTIIDTLDAAAEAVLAMRATRHYANEARLLFVAANQIRELKRSLAPAENAHPNVAFNDTGAPIGIDWPNVLAHNKDRPTEDELSGEDG